MDNAVSDADAFLDKTIEITEHFEEVVVEKTTRVVEEISIDKDVGEH